MAEHEQQHHDPDTPTISRAPTGLGVEPLNVVILGASYAGLACAHHFLDHTVDRLRTTKTVPQYRLILISPSTHMYWNIAAPRAIASPDAIAQEDLFMPIEAAFHRQRAHNFSIVQGEAMALDPETRTVTVQLISSKAQKRASYINKRSSLPSRLSSLPNLAKVQTISYHAIIMATGTSAHSELLTLRGPHLTTIGALNGFHARVAAAKRIVVCGAGASGVETAGQLATFLNYEYHWPIRKRANDAKRITLISGSDRCLPTQKAKVSKKAERALRSLGVEIRHDVRIIAAKEVADSTGRTELELDDNTFLTTDVYLPCTGVEPNSSYVPVEMRDARGYVSTSPSTLRVEHALAGSRTYAIGDVASYSRNCLQDVYAAVPVLMHNLLNDLLAYEVESATPGVDEQSGVGKLVDAQYILRPVNTQFWPISRFGGVGTIRDISIPGWLVYLLKGKHYRVGRARAVAERGESPYGVRGQGT